MKAKSLIDSNRPKLIRSKATKERPIPYTHFPANARGMINQSKDKRQTKDQSLALTFPRIHATWKKASNERPIPCTHFPTNSRDLKESIKRKSNPLHSLSHEFTRLKGKHQTKDQSIALTFSRIHATWRKASNERPILCTHFPAKSRVTLWANLHQSSINQSFILTHCVKELKNSIKIRTCINKIYNNYNYIILFNFKNNSINRYI